MQAALGPPAQSNGVIGTDLLRGPAGDKARGLVVVGLRYLHIGDLRGVEVAQHLKQERRGRHVVRVDVLDEIIVGKAMLCQPGVVVAVLRAGLKAALGIGRPAAEGSNMWGT